MIHVDLSIVVHDANEKMTEVIVFPFENFISNKDIIVER